MKGLELKGIIIFCFLKNFITQTGGQLQDQYIGCFIGNVSELIARPDQTIAADLSIEKCIQTCYNHQSLITTYAALLNGKTCLCIDEVGEQLPDIICSTACTGSGSQFCGGSETKSLSVYSLYSMCPVGFYGKTCKRICHCNKQFPCSRKTGNCPNGCEGKWTGSACNIGNFSLQYIGCYKDSGNDAMDVNNPVGSNKVNNSIEFCIQLCSSLNYTYAGMQYSIDCNCGEKYYKFGELKENSCNMNCAGNSTQKCGGTNANSVYHVCPIGYWGENCTKLCHCKKQLPCSKKTGSCPNGCDGNWTGSACEISSTKRQYIGCYKDSKPRALGLEFKYDTTLTIEKCINLCSSNNYIYAGMQYFGSCYCGDKYYTYGDLDESNCNTYCNGNRSQTCGGGWANSVYYACPVGFYNQSCDEQCGCAKEQPCPRTSCSALWKRCQPGWKGTSCSIRDCSVNNGDCGVDEMCETIYLGYTNLTACRCKEGFYRSNESGCKPRCRKNEDCISNKICVNTDLKYLNISRCECDTGFYWRDDLQSCEDIDECDMNPCNNVTENCRNLKGSYECLCKIGYKRYGNSCEDVDECRAGHDACDKEIEYCNNTIGSYLCQCKEGFERTTSDKCTDIDECLEKSKLCGPSAFNCTNTVGNYSCHYCSDGYRLNNGTCEAEAEHQPDSNVILIGIFVGILVALNIAVAVFLAFLFLKRKKMAKEPDQTQVVHNHSNDKEVDGKCSGDTAEYSNLSSISFKISITELPDVFKKKKSVEGTLDKEFKSVPTEDPTKTYTDGKRKELKLKNRFQNILPYDQNRVVLSKREDDSYCDYINASFITSYNKSEKLIATQGPTLDTLKDFWHMLDENNVGAIVMITKLIEDGKKKCACYWPEPGEVQEFDDMSVTLKKKQEWPNYLIRNLQMVKGSKTTVIKQFHFTAWPDHGVPSDIKGFLNFRRKVRQSVPTNKYIVVHCSAGVGRTGSFIAINYLLEQAEAEGVVDVEGCLWSLRQQRPQMVQTLVQYEFIYAALSIEFTVGNTVISAEDFDNIYNKLLTRDKSKGKTRIQSQFEVLQEQCSQQNENENPYRVFPRSIDASDIKNEDQAVFVQSWKKKDAYIISKCPDRDLFDYFWNCSLDYECKLIICLDAGQESDLFFPSETGTVLSVHDWNIHCDSSDEQTYGRSINLTLSHASESEYSNDVTLTTRGQVTLMLTRNLINKTTVDYDKLSALYRSMRTFTASNGSNSPPVVITAGVNCPLSGGYFVAAFNAFDMLEEENEVDLYQVAYDVKKSKSRLLPSLTVYENLHSVVKQHNSWKTSSTLYANT